MEPEILIIDIETTDLHPSTGFIVEVGIVALNLATGERKIVLDTLCREQGMSAKDRHAWIFTNSTLSVDEVRGAMDLQDLLPQIQEIINLYPAGATAYNRSFDFGFLEDRGVTFPKALPCPMKLATPVCKIPSRHPRHGQYKWPNVEECWNFLFPDLPYIELHRGADDAMHEAKIVYELYKNGHFKMEGK